MKLQEHANKLVTNAVDAVTQNFGVGDVSVLIDILRNRMYEHKVQTLVQEYICNARDAMREVGKGNEFDITVPTHLNPVFKVRDFGPGITPDRMANVFVLYGASTKRGTNTQTGGFGIGAKSAWSYTDSFTITTFVDGIKRSYIAHTGVNNNGRLDLISTENTKDKNGTEIQVAVKGGDITEFRDAILRAIYYWEEKPKLKGQLDVPELIRGYKIGNNFESISASLLPRYAQVGYEDHLAIIDGVPYSLNYKLLDKCKTLKKLTEFVNETIILHIDNGVVEVSASRESIADSPKTIESLEKLAHKVGMEIKTHVSDKFGKVKSPSEYIKVYRELVKNFSIESGFAKYGNYTIVNGAIRGDSLKKVKITNINCLGIRGRHKVNKITRKELGEPQREINLDLFDSAFYVKGKESGVVQNKRIRTFFEHHTKMLLIEPLDGFGQAEVDKVVSDLGLKDFQTITYVVLPKEQKIKISREKTEFCMHVLDGDRHRYTTLSENTTKWLYVPLTDKGWTTHFTIEQLKELNDYVAVHENAKICGLAERALKMIDGDSNYSPLKDWLDSFKPTKKAIIYAKSEKAVNKDILEQLTGVKGIDDPELSDLLEEYKTFEKGVTVPKILVEKINKLDEVKEFVALDESVKKSIPKDYKLLTEFSDYHYLTESQEMVIYLNAKFATR